MHPNCCWIDHPVKPCAGRWGDESRESLEAERDRYARRQLEFTWTQYRIQRIRRSTSQLRSSVHIGPLAAQSETGFTGYTEPLQHKLSSMERLSTASSKQGVTPLMCSCQRGPSSASHTLVSNKGFFHRRSGFLETVSVSFSRAQQRGATTHAQADSAATTKPVS